MAYSAPARGSTAGMRMVVAKFPEHPDHFNDDPRVFFSKHFQAWRLEDEFGCEWQWSMEYGGWNAVASEDEEAKFQSAFDVPGVGAQTDVNDPAKKRKAQEEAKAAKKQKIEESKREAPNNAIYVTGLPLDADEDEIGWEFKRYGMIAESWDTNKPRIKRYFDDRGDFNGEALIVFYKPQAVGQAIRMLNKRDFRSSGTEPGNLKVMEADRSFKKHDDIAGVNPADAKAKGRKVMTESDKAKYKAKIGEMEERLGWGDSDEDEPLPPKIWPADRMVVVKGLFTLEELAEDEDLYVEIRDDLKEQGAKFGEVTSVVVYDAEPEGVVTIRFKTEEQAKACIAWMDGQGYMGRKLKAAISKGSEKFKKKPWPEIKSPAVAPEADTEAVNKSDP